MRTATFIVALALTVPTTHALERARFLMGTVCEVAASGPDAEAQIESAFAEAKRVERMLSNWIDDSELSRVNRGAAPGEELRALLATTAQWTARTNGAFDPRYGERASARSGRTEARPAYDSGAFGKGYALDRMLALISGDALIDFGGQLIVRGEHEVAIADPKDREKPILALKLANASLSTSGNSERPGHIVDPRGGEPLSRSGSVSVIAADALTADILSTALFVMGDEEGLRWADAHGVAAIFITGTREVRLSAHAPRVAVLDPSYKVKE